jgi:hypothetical protein
VDLRLLLCLVLDHSRDAYLQEAKRRFQSRLRLACQVRARLLQRTWYLYKYQVQVVGSNEEISAVISSLALCVAMFVSVFGAIGRVTRKG